jgi:hypothetical protein
MGANRHRQSEDIQLMTAEESGQYVLLIVEAWLSNKRLGLCPALSAIGQKPPWMKIVSQHHEQWKGCTLIGVLEVKKEIPV